MEDVPVDVVYIRTNLIVDNIDSGLFLRPEKDRSRFCYSKNQISLKHNYFYQFLSEPPHLYPTETITRKIGQDTLSYSTLILGRYGGFGTFSNLGSDALEVSLNFGDEYIVPLALKTNTPFYKIIIEDSIRIELLNGNNFSQNQFQIEYIFVDCVDSSLVHNAIETHQINCYKNVPLPINFQVK
jgi:hypothetical protein